MRANNNRNCNEHDPFWTKASTAMYNRKLSKDRLERGAISSHSFDSFLLYMARCLPA